jgi:hypothetical protein
MATYFAALHEPLVEWVHEQTTAEATDYVTITPFGEMHGLNEHQSFQLLQAFKAWDYWTTATPRWTTQRPTSHHEDWPHACVTEPSASAT